MSQEKVNKYKEQKKNRKQEVKKEKRVYRLEMAVWGIIGFAFIGWMGYSAYGVITRGSDDKVVEYALDADALNDYMNGLSQAETAE